VSQFKKCHLSGNLIFNYLVISQSLKLRSLMEKFILISLKLNITLNTLGCYGLSYLKGMKNNFYRGKKAVKG